MKRLMLDHAFTAFDAAIFVIGADNRRSRIAIERTGAALTERRLNAVMAGRSLEHVIYRLARQA